MDISKNIKRLREELKMSKTDFSSRIGMDSSQYGRVENGKASITLERLSVIMETFNVGIEYFFDTKVQNDSYKEKYYELLEKYNSCLEEKDSLTKSDNESKKTNNKTVSK